MGRCSAPCDQSDGVFSFVATRGAQRVFTRNAKVLESINMLPALAESTGEVDADFNRKRILLPKSASTTRYIITAPIKDIVEKTSSGVHHPELVP